MPAIGEFRVDRVVETEDPWALLGDLLPDLTPDLMADHGDWLRPRYIDPADGRAVMSFHSFILRTGRYTILIDSCGGTDKERPARPIWHRQQHPYLARMAAFGVRPEQIDFVFCTHLHADHVGWNTQLRDGRWVPTFPNAKYLFHGREYEFWERAHREAIASGTPVPNHGSFADSVLPIVDAGRAVFVSGDHEIEHGIHLEPAYGHTPGACLLHAKSRDDHGVFIGDALHTPAQLGNPSLSSAFCWDREMSARTRRALCEKYADTNALMFATHFPDPSAYRWTRHRNGFKLV